MRLVFITQVLDENDGALGFVHAWILSLSKHVPSLTVIALKVGKYSLPNNVRVVSLGKERERSRMHYLSVLTRELVFGVGSYDRVFVHMNPEYLVLFGWWWKLMRKRTLLWYTHKLVDTKLKIATFFVNVVATASQESFRYRSNKVHVVGHGIDLSKILFSSKSENGIFELVTTGRVTPSKQLEVFIRALSVLRSKGVNGVLRIVGGTVNEVDVAYLATLQKLTAELSLEAAVTFVGPVPHSAITDELEKADCFVNASRTGGLDKAVLEAMAAGLPVATSNDGLATVLADYPELMFKNADSEDCAQVLLNIFSMQASRREVLCHELADIVERDHSLESLMPKLVKLLE